MRAGIALLVLAMVASMCSPLPVAHPEYWSPGDGTDYPEMNAARAHDAGADAR